MLLTLFCRLSELCNACRHRRVLDDSMDNDALSEAGKHFKTIMNLTTNSPKFTLDMHLDLLSCLHLCMYIFCLKLFAMYIRDEQCHC